MVGAALAVPVNAQSLIEEENMHKLQMSPNMGAARDVEDPLLLLVATDFDCVVFVLVLLVCALVFWLCITFMH